MGEEAEFYRSGREETYATSENWRLGSYSLGSGVLAN